MGVVQNLITGSCQTFLESCGLWTLPPASPHTLTSTRELIKFQELGSMKLTAGDSSDIIVTRSPGFPIGNDYGWDVRFFVWAHPESQATVTMKIDSSYASQLTASQASTIRGSQWTLCSVSIGAPLQTSVETPTITVSGLSAGESIYLTNPVIFVPAGISRNLFAAEVWTRLPEYIKNADELQDNPDHPLLRFLDVMFGPANEIYELWDRFRYIQPDLAVPGDPVSELQPSNASMETLRWWRQILGITFYDPTSGTSSWKSLMDVLANWTEWETEPDTADAGVDVQWYEIEDLNPGTAEYVESLRWQIITAYFGLRGGTRTAIIESVKKLLIGTKSVTFVEHDGGDPWAFRVQTLQSETPDNPTLGSSSATILEFVANAVPAGYELIHETVAG